MKLPSYCSASKMIVLSCIPSFYAVLLDKDLVYSLDLVIQVCSEQSSLFMLVYNSLYTIHKIK